MICAVDTVNAGAGDLEIEVNGGTVPCTVQSRGGNGRFRASFTPQLAIPHDISVRFNGQEVAGTFTFSVLSLVLHSTQSTPFCFRARSPYVTDRRTDGRTDGHDP